MIVAADAGSRRDVRMHRPRRMHLPHRMPLQHGASLTFGERTLVMGIVNVTPDSFSDGGRHAAPAAALGFARRLIDEGADLLDVGGESTRPGAVEVAAEEQMRRVLPVIRGLRESHPDIALSVDTRSAVVAAEAVAAGAHIVNDVSGLRHDATMAEAIAASGAAAIIMHMRGTPADMRGLATYDDVVSEVLGELGARLEVARSAGIRQVIADPGIGFAKTSEQSAALLAATSRFHVLGAPVLVGPSRKSFLALATGPRDGEPSQTRLHATVAAVTVAALGGAHIVRVHDVAPCADAVRLVAALRRSDGWTSPSAAARMGPGAAHSLPETAAPESPADEPPDDEPAAEENAPSA